MLYQGCAAKVLGLIMALGLLSGLPVWAESTTPTTDFTDNGDGTTTHNVTGLTWKRCAEGQSWSGTSCSGTAQTFAWQDANALGSNGWRLPSITELQGIVERANFDPAINTTIFPNFPSPDFPSPSMNSNSPRFWSATPLAGSAGQAWLVRFYHYWGRVSSIYASGSNETDEIGNTHHVLLVRGGNAPDTSAPFTPDSDFKDNGDGTVTHKTTGLMWKRCVEGQTWSGSICIGAPKGYLYSERANLSGSYAGYADWRLPRENELISLVEYHTFNPAINTTIFPDTPVTVFWASTPYAEIADATWWVWFDTGRAGADYNGWSGYVRLVRGGTALSPVPPSAPVFYSVVPWSTVGVELKFTVSAGVDSNGGPVGVSCTAEQSDHPDTATASKSVLVGNRVLTEHSITFKAAGTFAISCTTFNEVGMNSPSISRSIDVYGANPGADCFFDWAERNYADFFPSPGSVSKRSAEYFYRYYANTDSYLGISGKDSHVYYLNPHSNGAILNVGTQAEWFAKAGCN